MPLTKNKGSTYIGANDNLIINGDFSIWQRGTSFFYPIPNSQYTADRWCAVNNANVQRVPAGGIAASEAGCSYALSLEPLSAIPNIGQGIELPEAGQAGVFQIGTTWTLSYYARASAGSADEALRFSFSDSVNGLENSQVITTVAGETIDSSWRKYTHTFTVGVSPVGTNTCMVVEMRYINGTGSTILLAGIKLEKGSQVTPFVTASRAGIGGELALCQRYFEKSYDINLPPSSISQFGAYRFRNGNSGSTQVPVGFKVSKRVRPTVTYYNPNSGVAGEWRNATAGTDDNTGLYVTSAGISGYTAENSSVEIYNVYLFHWTADAEL